MIIVSQDKKFIVNFHNVIGLKVEQVNELRKTIGSATKTTFSIIARFSNEKLDCFLGKYATEERAKEVLEEIIEYYSLRNLGEMDCMSAIAYTQARRTSAFYMPAE